MYLSAKQVKDKYQITSQTLHNWRRKGLIVFKKLQSGKFLYEPLDTIVHNKKFVLYARVSNTKQKDDLERQKQLLRTFIVSNGKKVDDEYVDIASGMNEHRKDFLRLFMDCISDKIDTIYITYKDRLTRFGFNYLEIMFKKMGVEIVVLNATKEEDFQQELTQDLISIIHHFSMKMYSNRRKLLKELKEKLQDENT